MSKIKVVGDSFTVVTEVTTNELELLTTFAPEALTLKEDGEPIFAIAKDEVASISKNGIVFTSTNRDGFAYVTSVFPEANLSTEEKLDYIKKNLGKALLLLNRLEEQVSDAVIDLNSELDAVENCIELD